MPSPRLHHDEVDIDTALAQRLVAEQLPVHRGLPLHRVASGGTEHAVFRLGDHLALRMPMTPGAVVGLRKEVRWLPVLAPHLSLDIPEVVATGEPAGDYPFPWAVVRWLPGEDAMTERFASLHHTAAALGRFVADLQGIDMTDAPAPGSEGFARGLPLGGDAAVREILPGLERLIDVQRVAEAWADALAAPPHDGPPVWLHADLIPPNLLVRDGSLTGVLDFGAMATGDPAYDVTPAWHLLDRDTRPLFLDIVGADEATRRRARGVVVSYAVYALDYYLHTNPTMVAIARRGIDEVLADE